MIERERSTRRFSNEGLGRQIGSASPTLTGGAFLCRAGQPLTSYAGMRHLNALTAPASSATSAASGCRISIFSQSRSQSISKRRPTSWSARDRAARSDRARSRAPPTTACTVAGLAVPVASDQCGLLAKRETEGDGDGGALQSVVSFIAGSPFFGLNHISLTPRPRPHRRGFSFAIGAV
jgi:hypothetical protein